MNIIYFKNINFNEIYEKDDTQRNIGYSKFNNVLLVGRNIYYPNVLLYLNNNLISPYDEKIMSLNKDSFYDDNKYNLNDNLNENIKYKIIIEIPVFFFIYNFDNYYHFLYDTLPYLFTYLYLKKNIPNLKLLVNYPNKDKNEFYKFNTELLFKIINENDIIIHNEKYIYNNIYISSSLTHGGLSNNNPRKEIFEIYKTIKNNINYNNINEIYKNNIYKNIYISRRTYLNDDKSNIGTDYTSRRKMINETELVEELKKYNFQEIFSENLNTDEKIYLFSNADKIVGSIGGGMANLLFSPKKLKSYIIVSPYFLDINYRFRFSMEHTNIQYFNDTTVFKDKNINIPLYVRVIITNENNINYNKIGEIINYENNKYKIAISNNDVAGFNNNIKFEYILFEENNFKLLDEGLNSPYIFNYKMLINNIIL